MTSLACRLDLLVWSEFGAFSNAQTVTCPVRGQQQLTTDELLLGRGEANSYQRGLLLDTDKISAREKHVTITKRFK